MRSRTHTVVDLIRRMPPGPERDAAERGHAMVREFQRRGLVSNDYSTALAQMHAAKPQADRMYAEQQQYDATRAEVVAFGNRLTQSDLQTIQQWHDAGGWPAVEAGLSQCGLAPDAVAMLRATYQETGGNLAAVREIVAEHVQASARDSEDARAFEATAERTDPAKASSPAAKHVMEHSPAARTLRDPAAEARMREWYGPRAADLEAKGIGRKPGQSYTAWALDLARQLGRDGTKAANLNRQPFGEHLTPDQALQSISELLGDKDTAGLRNLLESVDDASTQHDLLSRLSARDRKVPEGSKPDGKAAAGSVRASVERAARGHVRAAKQEPYAAGNRLQATIARAAGMDVVPLHGSSHAEKAVAEVNAELDANEEGKGNTNGDGADE